MKRERTEKMAMDGLRGDAEALGRTIHRLRKSRRLTQDELSLRLGLKRPELTRIEKGACRASLETILKIFEELDVEVEELICGSDA